MNISTREITAWVKYNKEDDDKYLIRYVNNRSEFFNEDGTAKDGIKLFDYIIKDWKNITVTKDGKSTSFKCTEKNKILFIEACPDIVGFLAIKSQQAQTFFNIDEHLKN